MIDGKTFGVVSNSSNQSCGICGATPKIMNLRKFGVLPRYFSKFWVGGWQLLPVAQSWAG
jgi:hypothetical protein